MNDGKIAGHIFDLRDRCTLVLPDGSVCNKRWLDIHLVDHSYNGLSGYAHVMNLNANECGEIMKEKARRDALFAHAIAEGSGLTRSTPTPEPEDADQGTGW